MLIPASLITFGDSIGKYRFIAEVATGGMGVIYLAARHGPAGFSQLVAVKELKPEFAQDPSFVGMFLEEGRIAARFSHPNVVQTLETDHHDGRYFIVMEYLEGRSFGRIQKRFLPQGGFPTWMSLAIMCDVLSALDYVHELVDDAGRPLGLVHRDVSPQNIFITFDGYTKVIDFGIAKSRESAQKTQNGVLKGKLCYMAPEQLAHEASRKSDIFSAGAILFEIITGRMLWQGKTDLEIFGHLSRSEIPAVEAARADVPAPLLEICKKALNPRSNDRFESAAEMRDAIGDYLWKTGRAEKVHAAQAIAQTVQNAFGPERERIRTLVRSYFAQLERGYRGPLQRLTERTSTGTPAAQSVAPIAAASLMQADLGDFERKTVETKAPPLALGSARVRHFWAVHRRVALMTMVVGTALGAAIGFWPREQLHDARSLEMHLGAAPHVPPPPPPAVPAPALPETVLLSVTVAPSNAQIAIDGQNMPSNPFLGRYEKSTATHLVRVSAQGYLSKERLVTFADNVVLDLSLNPRPEPRDPPPRRREFTPQRRVAAPPAAPPLPPPVVVQARPAPEVDIAPKGRSDGGRRRRIETSNPYQEDQ